MLDFDQYLSSILHEAVFRLQTGLELPDCRSELSGSAHGSVPAFSGPGNAKEAAVDDEDIEDFPLVSRGVLHDLQAALAAPGVYSGYVCAYTAMWPCRFQRLVAALDAGNQEVLMDAVLSVKTSAGMLGALRLARLASEIEDAVRHCRMDWIGTRVGELELCGRLTVEQLRHELGQDPVPGQRQDGQ